MTPKGRSQQCWRMDLGTPLAKKQTLFSVAQYNGHCVCVCVCVCVISQRIILHLQPDLLTPAPLTFNTPLPLPLCLALLCSLARRSKALMKSFLHTNLPWAQFRVGFLTSSGSAPSRHALSLNQRSFFLLLFFMIPGIFFPFYFLMSAWWRCVGWSISDHLNH